MGHEPGVWSRPTGGEYRPLLGVEMTKDKFELVYGGSDQDNAFAHGPALEVKNSLDSMLIARVGTQPPDTLGGISHHATGGDMLGSLADQWVRSIVQGILWGSANGAARKAGEKAEKVTQLTLRDKPIPLAAGNARA